MGGKEVVWIVH